MNRNIICVMVVITAMSMAEQCYAQKDLILETGKYELYHDSIVEGKYVAKSLSATEIVSNYQSLANSYKSPQISFKFSINGKDNEMVSGMDHHFSCLSKDGECITPIIKFGTQLKDNTNPADNTYLPPNTKLCIRVDLGNVFNDFNNQGYYTTFSRD